MPDRPPGKRIGRCIYCGSTESLSDEHVMPRGLGGRLILRDASCEACRNITSAFETVVQRHLYGDVREARNFPSGTRKKRRAVRKQRPSGAPAGYVVFELPPPVLLGGQRDANVKTALVTYEATGSKWVGGHKVKQRYRMSDLARTLAKIAHGYAVNRFDMGGFAPLVTGLVRGTDADIANYVGGLPPAISWVPNRAVSVGVVNVGAIHYLVVYIRLPFDHMPVYAVVTGTVADTATLVEQHGIETPPSRDTPRDTRGRFPAFGVSEPKSD